MATKGTGKQVENTAVTRVEVSLPSKIHIELVQGNELRHYEIFFSLGSIALSVAVGFWTGYITTSPSNSALFWSAIAFSGLTVFSIAISLFYRHKVYDGMVVKSTTLDDFNNK